jgi:hypothetical protein
LTFKAESKQRNIGGLLSSDVIPIYKLKIYTKEKESGGPVFGFCYGTSFYFYKGIYNSDTYNYCNLDLIFLKLKLSDGDYLSLEYRFFDYFNQSIGNNLNPLCCLRIHMRIEF